MSTITTRSGKGSPLTHDEVDSNFTNLNTDKYESGDSPSFAGLTVDTDTLYVDSTNNRVGIGTTSPATKLNVEGTSIIAEFKSTNNNNVLRIKGNNATNGVLLGSTSSDDFVFGTIATERMRINSSGNVGIGTTVQANRLEVEGAVVAQGAVDSYTNDGLYLSNEGSSNFKIGAWRSGANAANLVFGTDSGSDAAPVERMRIKSDGNVSIGNVAEVTGLRYFDLYNTGSTSTDGSIIRLITEQVASSSATTVDIYKRKNGEFRIANKETNSAAYTAFTVGSTERMRINSSGNVGIGTSSPSYALDVVGDIRIDNQAGSPDQILMTFQADMGTYDRNFSIKSPSTDSASEPFRFVTGNSFAFEIDTITDALVINSSGNVGIGTSSPSKELHIVGAIPTIRIEDSDDSSYGEVLYNQGSGGLLLRSDVGNTVANSNIIFQTDNAEAMRITSSGNVGIGTTSPSQLLEVRGVAARIRITDTDTSGTTGIEFVDSANTVDAEIEVGNSTQYFAIKTASSEAMRITSTGNVGIGTSSPVANLDIEDSDTARIQLKDTGDTRSGLITARNGDVNIIAGSDLLGSATEKTKIQMNDGKFITFSTDSAERMRIDSDGDLLLNTTVTGVQNADAIATDSSVGRLYLNTTSTSGLLFLNQSYNDTVARYQILFYRNEAIVGSITSSTSTTTYSTTSDYRLKENLNAISNGIDRVKQLNPLRFNFIANPEETVDGFLAHEVDSIVPEAITGEKDALDEKGNIDPQQIDQSKLVPLLTAALQEAITKIETLEARVTALES